MDALPIHEETDVPFKSKGEILESQAERHHLIIVIV